MKHHQLFAALLCAVTTPLAQAATETIDEVVVTATRTAQAAEASLASVTVITRQDIEQLQAQSLPDVLRGVQGLTLSNNGGAGKSTSVFLRGTNADHVLVLLDGVKIGSATTGTAPFENIPVAQIERIEIVRGPRASLYGSDAIGGVIQIFTRKGGKGLSPSVSFTAGSYGTYNSQAGLSGGNQQGWFNAKVDQQNTTGFNACSGSLTAGCYVLEPDNDGYHSTSLGLNGGYQFAQNATLELNALKTNSTVQTDGSIYAGNQATTAQQLLGAALKLAPVSAWNMTLRGGSSNDNSDIFFNGLYISRYNTRRDTLSWQNDVEVAQGQLASIGLDYQNDSIDALPSVSAPGNVFTRTARSNQALFAQYQADFGAHNMEVSARHDDNQQFGGHDTGGLGYGYELSDSMRLTASYGTAFKAPTFNQLYYPNYGTTTLRPESSRSLEAGVAGRTASGKWSLNAYQTDIADMIGNDANYKPVNINTARLTGLEGLLKVRLSEWDVNAALTLQDPRQTSGANQGKLLTRRATETARIELAHAFGAVRVASALYAEGRRFDDLANTPSKELAGYGLLDVRAEYRLAPEWLLQGRVDNLLDKQYETAQYFNQPGRAVYFTLSYQGKN
jgi:vitamin B12 transporter